MQEATALGPDGGNALQYTGRENDGTGLYFYRARYYDPVLKRFISEDPIGIAGGANLTAYVRGNPISFTDPLGLERGDNRQRGYPDKSVEDYCTWSPEFYPKSCARHDQCYRDACKSRRECDRDFYRDMQRERPWMPEIVPAVYWFFVDRFGDSFYGTP